MHAARKVPDFDTYRFGRYVHFVGHTVFADLPLGRSVVKIRQFGTFYYQLIFSPVPSKVSPLDCL